MRDKRKIILILIVGFIMGLSLSGIGTYAATTYAISATKIGYSDNSNLGADNVQAAIDGTCSKVDTRLGNIEKSKQNTLTTTTGTVSINFKILHSSGDNCTKAYKYGNTVMYNCAFAPESDISTNTSILTFPDGYRPISQTYVTINVSGTGYSYNAILRTTGNLSLANNNLKSNVWYQFSITFISS